MRIFFLLCLCGLVCALPARQSPFYERFKNIPIYEADDDDSVEDEKLFEAEERSFGGRRNNHNHQGLDLERFKNIPLVFLDKEDSISRSAVPQRRAKPSNMPLFYYAEQKQNVPNSRRVSNRFRNVPLIFLNEEPESYDDYFADDDSYEIELHYDDDESVPPVYKKPVHIPKPKPSRKPQNNKPKPNRPNRPNRPQKPKPVQKPVTKPTTTQKPVVDEVEQEVKNQQQEQETSPVFTKTVYPTKKSTQNTIEILKGDEKIEIPIPKSLEIVAFITKDGSIYEIDNGDENLLLVGKNTEKTEDLKTIMEKSLQHTINKILVNSDESGKAKAVIEVHDPIDVQTEVIVEDLVKQDVATDEAQKKEEEKLPVESQPEEILSTPAPVDKYEFPLLRNANVDTISTY
ncbi:hypothetical protein ACFFRR_002746 [Megaselia abdita]